MADDQMQQDEWWWDEAARAFFPGTVTRMSAPGGVVYLVGTAHGQRASVDDVALVIQAVQPHAVCIEMCRLRVVLDHDITDSAQTRFDELHAAFDEDRTEFHKALAEASRLRRGCILHLIDRPIDITAQRLSHALSTWDRIRARWLRFHGLRNDTISESDANALRARGAADRAVASFEHAFPRLHHVLVVERDAIMSFRLQQAALPDLRVARPGERMRVVGVVGLAHVTGIHRRFNLVEVQEANKLLEPVLQDDSGSSSLLVAAIAVGVMLGVGFTRLISH